MSTFENPANGHREAVGGLSVLWAALFGLLYFLAKGVWTHAVIQLLLIGVFSAVSSALPPLGVLLLLVTWVGYAFAAPTILENRYRRLGWLEVGFDGSSERAPIRHVTAAPTPRPATPAPEPQPETRECPQCAETVKAAAKICRFCRAELEPLPKAPAAFSAGVAVSHRVSGNGVIIQMTDAGEAVVKFDSQEVRAVSPDYLKILAPKSANQPKPQSIVTKSYPSGATVSHPVYGEGLVTHMADGGDAVVKFGEGNIRAISADNLALVSAPTNISAGTPVIHRVMGQGVVTSLTPDGEAVVQFNDGSVRAVAVDYLTTRNA